jgi:hypothetical protein
MHDEYSGLISSKGSVLPGNIEFSVVSGFWGLPWCPHGILVQHAYKCLVCSG